MSAFGFDDDDIFDFNEKILKLNLNLQSVKNTINDAKIIYNNETKLDIFTEDYFYNLV